jgi:hypothetical protein
MFFVIKQPRSFKVDRVFNGDVPYDSRRIKKPIAVMFPVADVVAKFEERQLLTEYTSTTAGIFSKNEFSPGACSWSALW